MKDTKKDQNTERQYLEYYYYDRTCSYIRSSFCVQ